jgi:hypothetical protein
MATATTQMLFCLHPCSSELSFLLSRTKGQNHHFACGRPELPLQSLTLSLMRTPFGSWRFATHADLARPVPLSLTIQPSLLDR